MDRKEKFKRFAKNCVNRTANVAEGAARNAANFAIKLPKAGNNVVNIMDKSFKTARGKATWWIRYDRPHRGAMFNHINANPKITGVPDPHTAISAAHLNVCLKIVE